MTERSGAEALWMPFYVADYLRDTQHLSAQEHGAYMLLIFRAWTSGGLLPLDETRLARIAGLAPKEWKASRCVILEFFTRSDDGYRHKRIDRELERTDAKIEQRRAAGKASAAARSAQREGERGGDERSTGVGTKQPTNGQRNGRHLQSHTPLEHKGSNGQAPPDADQVFWANAKSFIQPEAKGDPGAVIGKWCREHGREATAQAITRAQLERPVERIPFIIGCLKHAKQEGGLSVPC